MNYNLDEILKNIDAKGIKIAVVGMGYVGLPLALEFALKNIETLGFEVDSNKCDMLNNGENYNQDLDSEEVKLAVDNKMLSSTTDFSRLTECDAIFICVPTPFTVNKDPDISFILQSAEDISKYLRKGQIIILKSTTFPGTTEKYLKPILEKNGLIAGEDFALAFSPERIDPGNKTWNTRNTPIVVGGLTENCTKYASAVTKLAVDNIHEVNSPSIAEMEKLLENIFRSVNIALVNEMAKLCDRIGVNVWDVVDAAATKPFGFMPFYPGPGIGGHCILIDPYYLAWMAREKDFVTKFITLAAEINEDMPFYVRSMIIKEIAKQPVTMMDARILMLGMAFKKDVDDLRHSPALKIAELLFEDGIKNVDYYDSYIPEIKVDGETLNSLVELNADVLAKYDVVVVTTDHSDFDLDLIAEHSKVIVDTRNAFKGFGNRENIILIGEGK
jgi:UDP-N-acetyl-D-glucosamine dehydrogenase